MADISLLYEACLDDTDEGVYEESELNNVDQQSSSQTFIHSNVSQDRKMVVRMVQNVLRMSSPEKLDKNIPAFMKLLQNIAEGDDPMAKADLLEQIPQLAAQAIESSQRVEWLKNIIGAYLLPLVLRNLDRIENAIDKVAKNTLLTLLEQNLITKRQAEIQVCPAVLALSNKPLVLDIVTGAITFMGKLAPLLGRDITERIFMDRFAELCNSEALCFRQICATQIGAFCVVVGQEKFEKILLPLYIKLCDDEFWGVRKACASVIIFVSSVCSMEVRRSILAPIFLKCLNDECRWVTLSSFQVLGPFIATFADPSITNVAYNKQHELVFVDKDGNEFSNLSSSTVPDGKLYNYVQKISLMSETNNDAYVEQSTGTGTWWSSTNDDNNEENDMTFVSNSNIDSEIRQHSYKEQIDRTNSSINDISEPQATLDLDSLNDDVNLLCNNKQSSSQVNTDKIEFIATTLENEIENENKIKEENNIDDNKNQVNFNEISNDNKQKDNDTLKMFNSYNYWYISPDIPIDLNIFVESESSYLESLQNLSPSGLDEQSRLRLKIKNKKEKFRVRDVNICTNEKPEPKFIEKVTYDEINEKKQNIVPQDLIDNFISMADTFTLCIDLEFSYHCAYSLPAVVLTLGRENWPLLKSTVEVLSNNMQYKVRRIIASCLHELAEILGTDITTRDLTPIFEGFIKDLDEVRIGILKNLSKFLYWVKPLRRRTYLSKLNEFYDDANWRFRYELAIQLKLCVPLFKPNLLSDIADMANTLLDDKVAAVREAAIFLVIELTMYFSKIHGLNSRWLVVLSEACAHSKKWQKRQTFASLCFHLLAMKILPSEQFAIDIMPHLLDLSWDPVANVRLVVARTISKHIITNDYFLNPNNQHLDTLGTVLRRLKADKDKDVRFATEDIESNILVSSETCLNKLSILT